MTRDEIIKLATQAGWQMPAEWDSSDGFSRRLERFARAAYEAGAAAEREACAELCASDDSRAVEWLPEFRVGIYFAKLIRITRDAK